MEGLPGRFLTGVSQNKAKECARLADIPRIQSPIVEKPNINMPMKPAADPTVPFNLSNVTQVVQPHDASEILQQNTGYIEEQAPRILADLLGDPSVTVGTMQNIYLLQEVIKLLPANNTALTGELEQLFSRLMLNPQDIVPELMRQEQSTTLFKGELFDMLRGLLSQQSAQTGQAAGQNALQQAIAQGAQQQAAGQNGQAALATGVGVLLKALNASISQSDTLNSVANNLQFLANNLGTQGQLADKLLNLIPKLRSPDAPAHFSALKEQTLSLLGEVQNSVLYTPQMEKIIPLTVYNLSRFNDNPDFLPQALKYLMTMVDGDAAKTELLDKLQTFMDKYASPQGSRVARAAEEDSRVMDVLSRIIGRETSSDELKLMSGDKLDKIVHSLLSSPSNFTPLLHFVLPVQFEDLRAFAEIWIDPNAEEETASRGPAGDSNHMLMVFDVEGVGRFETELFVQNKRIAMNLLCPPAYYEAFKGIDQSIRSALSASNYTFEAINIDRLERTHSLMDVFTELPKKRTGIDVKI